MLSIFSFASWLSVCRIWRDSYLDLPPLFYWIAWFLISSSVSCLYILEINPLLLHLQIFLPFSWASQVALVIKNPCLLMQEIQEKWVWSLGREDSPGEGNGNPSSILAWEIPWTEEPSGLQSMRLQRVRHDWATTLAHTPVLRVICSSC